MKTFEIKAELRETLGKKETKKLRKTDHVPCVLYNKDGNIHFYAHENSFRKLVYSPEVFLVKLNIGDKSYNAIIQEIQFHPVTDKMNHIDFLQIFPDKPVSIEVPVKTKGLAPGVAEGGKMKVEARKLRIRGLMDKLPESIIIDVSKLTLGKIIKTGAIKFDDFELIEKDNLVVVSVKLTRVAKGMAAAEEGVEEIEEEVEGEEEGGDSEAEKAEE